MKFEGRAVLITGAGSGIGRAVARTFQQGGAELILNDIREDALQSVALELGLPDSRMQLCDVSDERAVGTMFDAAERLGLSVEVLVNSAGMAEPNDRWERLNAIAEARLTERELTGRCTTEWDVTRGLDTESWQRMLDVHLNGTFFCCREALGGMTTRGRGAIVNLSSAAALAGLPDAPHYAAAKAGILGFTRSLARDVASRNIRVNAVAPGYTETPMTEAISTSVREASYRGIPLGRWATPSEIAAAVVFLASDDASYMTGQCLSVNGGVL